MSLSYQVQEAFRSLFRAKRLNAISLAGMSIALMALGLVLIVNLGVMRVALFVEGKVEVVVFLSDTATSVQAQTFLDKVKNHPEVVHAMIVSSDQAALEFSADPALAHYLKVLGSNPLPASVRIQLRDKTPETVRAFSQWLKQLPGSAEVVYGEGDADRLLRVLQFVRLAVFLLSLALAISAVIIVSNIISLMLYARQQEISILRALGASAWFVRGPFLIWGLVQGAAAGLLASGLLWALWTLLAYLSLDQLALDLYVFLPPQAGRLALTGTGWLTLTGSAMGLLACLFAIRGRWLE